MNKNIDEDFAIDLDILETPHGLFTSNTHLGLSAREVYEQYLHELENPTPPKPSLEEVVKEQENKISILEQSQLSQDEGIMQGMMGTAEVCEMVIMLQEQVDAMQPNPVALNINNKLGGKSAMVEVYANLVLAGKYTCEPSEAINGVKLVPSVYREQVKAKLIEWSK